MLQDDAPVHSTLLTVVEAVNNDFGLSPHYAYSQGLAPSYFLLFIKQNPICVVRFRG